MKPPEDKRPVFPNFLMDAPNLVFALGVSGKEINRIIKQYGVNVVVENGVPLANVLELKWLLNRERRWSQN